MSSNDNALSHLDTAQLNLSVDMRLERPFHCNECGDTFEACRHWDNKEEAY